jgi:hypothetical protein
MSTTGIPQAWARSRIPMGWAKRIARSRIPTAWAQGYAAKGKRNGKKKDNEETVANEEIVQWECEEMFDASTADHAAFGLSEDMTDWDLDNAYRQLAKQIHPDKNAGTEESKENFQRMKERYDVLKARPWAVACARAPWRGR